jgi:hypothetical protein
MTKTTWLRRLTLLCGTFALSLIALPASANTITPSYVSSVGGVWTYQITLTQSQVQTGDFFTILDFGDAGFSAAPAGWSFSQSLVGPAVPNVTPADNASVNNVTFTWTGATFNADGVILLPFVITTTLPDATVFGFWSSQDHLINVGGPAQGATGNILIPNVPDGGSTMALLGLTLVAVAGVRRKFNL